MAITEEQLWKRAKVLHRHPSIELVFDEETGIFITHWLGYTAAPDYRSALERALELARPLKIRAWVGDNRRNRIISPENQRWTSDEWWNEFATLGHRRLAVVVGADLFNRLSVDRIIMKASPRSPWETQHFDALQPAIDWAAAAP